MKSNIEIRDICVEDAQDIADIYNYYIENTTITFEEDQVSGRDFEARIRNLMIKAYLGWSCVLTVC